MAWVAAVALICLATGITGYSAYRQKNVCIAYIHGEKCTDAEIVMQQMQMSLRQIGLKDARQPTVEGQLNDLFRTMQENADSKVNY